MSCDRGKAPDKPGLASPLDEVNALLMENPGNPALLYTRAQWYYDQGLYKKAADDLAIAVKDPTAPLEVHHLYADALLDSNQSLEALSALKAVVAVFPNSTPSLLKLSEFQLITKQHEQSLATLQKVLKIDPQEAEAHFMRGMVLKERGDTAAARTAFHEATAESPELIDAWIELGNLYSDEPREALRYFDAALRAMPDHVAAMHAKAVVQTQIDALGAMITYRQLIEIAPFYADAYFNMGLIYLDQDSLGQAGQHFDLAVDTDPQFTNAYFYRGLVHELMANLESARLDYDQALRLDPQHERAAEALNRVTPPTENE
ncbi:MAG: tetratricopeptide repeat protein [Saprospiraceae bacterium]|nr:tetratricopeptide repeat protein [Saprospiraceae bacterium]